MSLTNFWVYIGGLLAFCAALDKISTYNWKSIVAEPLTNLDRRTFTQYVAGNALTVYEKIFSKVILSWSFFFRSALITLGFAAISLWFLFYFFPHTFYAATSYVRSYLNSPNTYFATIFPVILFVLFDYICNGQTKYFLEIMRSSGSLSKFMMIGYADLVVTSSIGILSVSLSILIFSFFSLTVINKHSKVIINFTQPYDFHTFNTDLIESHKKEGNFLHVVSYKIPVTDFDRLLNEKEASVLQKYPIGLNRFTYINEDPGSEETYLIKQINQRGVVQSYWTDNIRAQDFLFFHNKEPKSLESACKLFANAGNNNRFRFQTLKGWDTELIFDSCKNQKSVELQLDLRVRQNAINYKKILASTLGNLITQVTDSLLTGFDSYLGFGPIELIDFQGSWNLNYGHWLIGKHLDTEARIEKFLENLWRLQNGGKRYLERGGYPWSTFFVVTLFTSMFIWLVIITCILLYPAIFILEKIAGEKRRIEVEKYPFTTIFLILFIYFLIYEIVVQVL